MNIAKVLAVYRVSSLRLVVEAEDGTVVELSLNAIAEGAHRLSDIAWKDLLETYQLFTCQATQGERVRLPRSARHQRPPARDEAGRPPGPARLRHLAWGVFLALYQCLFPSCRNMCICPSAAHAVSYTTIIHVFNDNDSLGFSMVGDDVIIKRLVDRTAHQRRSLYARRRSRYTPMDIPLHGEPTSVLAEPQTVRDGISSSGSGGQPTTLHVERRDVPHSMPAGIAREKS